ncbi:TetR/AcrR family transcriptional regulator [Pseudonocardiaceae bacterium YIM PH 21723]|nr:TetR/AcrR family transcriptional regulator [Pseudonocardiaceae bacterium YIM PH 21723]
MSPEERREQLLDATLQVIVTQGIHKVSMDSVAKEAGVTRPVVYGIFTDANDLLRASLDHESQFIQGQLAELFPRIDMTDPLGSAITLLDGFLHVVRAAPDRWRAAFAMVDSVTPAYRRRVEQTRSQLIELLEGLLSGGVQDGRLISGTDVEMLARTLFALVWDYGRITLAEPDRFPPERIVAFARERISGLLVQ